VGGSNKDTLMLKDGPSPKLRPTFSPERGTRCILRCFYEFENESEPRPDLSSEGLPKEEGSGQFYVLINKDTLKLEDGPSLNGPISRLSVPRDG
jgi:hypothetical protein